MRYVAHYRVAGLNLSAEAVNNFSDGLMLLAWIVAGLALRGRRHDFSSGGSTPDASACPAPESALLLFSPLQSSARKSFRMGQDRSLTLQN